MRQLNAFCLHELDYLVLMTYSESARSISISFFFFFVYGGSHCKDCKHQLLNSGSFCCSILSSKSLDMGELTVDFGEVKTAGICSPSEEFDLTKMSWGDHDIRTATPVKMWANANSQ